MKILVNRTALIRAIANAAGLSPLQDEQRKAMFARQGQRGGGGGGGGGSGSRTSTTTTKGGTTTVKTVQTKPAPQPQQPIWDPVAGKWWFPPSKNDPRPTPKPPYAIIDPTRPIMGIPERPPYGSPPPRYYIPVPTPKPQPKPAPKPVTKPSPAPPSYREPPRITLPINPYLPRPWI